MSDERRYDDQEVAEILERATAHTPTGTSPALPDEPGMTLQQLQEIGAEVGIPPARIAEAAAALAPLPAPGAPAPVTLLGAPRSVSRIVPIVRALGDREWDRLVADLRHTFGATGTVSEHGSLRSWANGNLQVHVEPDGDHYRVRMHTLKGDAGPYLGLGVAAIVCAVVLVLAGMMGELTPVALLVGAAFGVYGVAQVAQLRAALPRWADERAAQMEGLAARIPLLLQPGPDRDHEDDAPGDP